VRVHFAAKPHLPTPGGAQLTTHWLALEMVRRGHDVTVLAEQQVGRPAAPSRETRWGYPTINAEDPPAQLARLLDEAAPDCVVVGGYGRPTDALTTSLLAATAGAPTVYYLHDTAAVPHVPRSRPVRLAAVSEFLAREVEARRTPCAVIPPIVDLGAYRVDTSRRVALFVNPVPTKGVDLALALARARPHIPFAFTRCWWIDDEDLRRLRTATAELGNVELRDAVADPAALYGDARVLLVPSRYPEAWGRVVSEAQASGIPAIARAVGGLPEAVGDGGLLLPEDAGLEEWAAALDSLWEDEPGYARWSARAAAQAGSGKLSAAAVGDRFEALLSGQVPPSLRNASSTCSRVLSSRVGSPAATRSC
jgi:glycosyltransferase involved in cell wall biosynthesis